MTAPALAQHLGQPGTSDDRTAPKGVDSDDTLFVGVKLSCNVPVVFDADRPADIDQHCCRVMRVLVCGG